MKEILSHTCTWIIDSGASEHITCDNKNLFNISVQPFEPSIKIPNGELVPVSAIGSLCLPNGICLQRVLYVPQFQCNLLSVSRLTSDLNCTFIFSSSLCILRDTSTGKLIGVGKLHNGLYYLESSRGEMVAMSVGTRSDLWHQRLGHASDGKLQYITSLKDFRRNSTFCDPCLRAKQTRLPFPESTKHIHFSRCHVY
ncbi:unnamed protein product [Cuscuta epithymum]|uniref:GAG-pre-integrase domain-containing protein n=1 Tax=Cuscuta epithymum TaxID=186058 RepID=A0AAV0GM39_9ASTE|nr:unnamed protein product [Cuscuta epithymum]CAH9149007.1 unnamed protein product [Cuscuta epithymum]